MRAILTGPLTHLYLPVVFLVVVRGPFINPREASQAREFQGIIMDKLIGNRCILRTFWTDGPLPGLV